MKKHRIYNVGLTGGPCSGKTTSLTYIRQKLEDRGYIVLVVPEAASLCINGGLSPINAKVGTKMGQEAIIHLAWNMENIWRAKAEGLCKFAPVVILYDRGIPDSLAYMPRRMYGKILKKLDQNPEHVRDQHYHGVVHMVTAADGAEEFYTLANNAARYETPAEARAQDRKIQNAWIGHEHLRIVGNSKLKGFSEKVIEVFNEVCVIIGAPPIEQERKFLVSFKRRDLPRNAQRIEIEQFYPVSDDPNITLRLRKRGQNGNFTYYETRKQPCGHGKNVEIQDFTTENRYRFSLPYRRPDTGIVRKIRTCFLHGLLYMELDKFVNPRALPKPTDALLEIETPDMTGEIEFPDWIDVQREVTGNPAEFTNLAIAMKLARRA